MSRRYEFEGHRQNSSQTNSIRRYRVNLQIEQSRLMQIKKAPPNQFVKYLDNTDNIFYEDRQSLKRLKQIKQSKPILVKFTIYLFLSFLVVYLIDPYQKPCPQNAWCGAYIHCNQNYVLTSSYTCKLDPQVIAVAKQFVYSIVQNIKYNHGNQQCWSNLQRNSLNFKNSKLNQILDENYIQNQLRTQIWKQFSDKNNQELLKFYLNPYGQIHVMQKKYSYSCHFYLFSKTKYFFVLVIFVLLSCFGMFLYNQKRKTDKKAIQIYKYLHDKVKKYHKIDVKQQLNKIENIKQVLNSKLWVLVDNERLRRAEIVYYEDVTLKWKLLI